MSFDTKKKVNEAKEMRVQRTIIDLKTGERKEMFATVTTEQDDKHQVYSLTYEGYRSAWGVQS